MKHLLIIALAVMLTACSPKDSYQAPQAAAKAIQMCASYGGVDKTGTTTYNSVIDIHTYCKDGTYIKHRIARE